MFVGYVNIKNGRKKVNELVEAIKNNSLAVGMLGKQIFSNADKINLIIENIEINDKNICQLIEQHNKAMVTIQGVLSGVGVGLDKFNGILNPWKDASKELPKERVDAGIKSSDVVLCWVNIRHQHDMYVPAFYDYCAELWKDIRTGEALSNEANVAHWMHIPETPGE